MVEAKTRARILVEALPYIREFADKVMVVKLGGHAMLDPELERCFAEDVVLLKAVGIHPVVVHGGGPQIEELLQKLGVECRFVQGMRVTDAQTLDVVEMILGGTVNGRIVTRINTAGGIALGLSGRDGNLLKARPYRLPVATEERTPELIDLGHVGEVEDVNADLILQLSARKMIPVIAPLGVDGAGQAYNINADLVAGAVAAKLKAEKLILLTDVAGVMDQDGNLLGRLTREAARQMTEKGVIKGGMIPKVKCALDALDAGVTKVHIIDGRTPHAVLLEIFTDAGVGTEIVGE
ncbi:MAG TPA: acetylglutamate kinase [bacterium]|nr:acetylglutamate kinase [bacterium]